MMSENELSSFEVDVELYDAIVDWPKRLANEEPFFRRWFDQCNVDSVLDTSCGTGHHADMFHSWDLRVEGADISEAMIEHCRKQYGESETLSWVVRSFDRPHPQPGSFGAVVCTGNSLALAGEIEVVDKAITAMLASIKPGGFCVVHVLNLWRLTEGKTVWQKCQRLTLQGKDRLVLKGVRRVGSQGCVEVIDVDLSGGKATAQFEAPTFLGLEAVDLQAMIEKAGGDEIRFFGNYANDPYDRKTSVDLIAVCRRYG